MRIQVFSEITEVSKRTIHFYIKEKLLFPKNSESNGYFDFSDEDVTRLLLIKRLRELGFSISVIRSILNNPISGGYYLRRQIGYIEEEMERLSDSLKFIKAIRKKLPANPNMEELTRCVLNDESGRIIKPSQKYDGELVNHFLWKTFWPTGELSEYQQFIWEKMNRLTDENAKKKEYVLLYHYLCQQNQKKIDALYATRNSHFNRIAELSEAGVLAYAEEMKEAIRTFIHTGESVKQWKEHYHTFLVPQLSVYTGEIGRLAHELSDFFHTYQSNSLKACELVYEWLKSEDGISLYEEIQCTLQGVIDLENYKHAELESMNTVFTY